MFLLDWYKQWMDIRTELRLRESELNPKICESCETLKHQLEISNHEKKQLLDRLLEKPEPVKEVVRNETPMMLPRNIPWNVRRQMLEAEDREKARVLKNAPKPDSAIDKVETEELEKALDLAAEQRDKQSS
jgi:hypothetical protein